MRGFWESGVVGGEVDLEVRLETAEKLLNKVRTLAAALDNDLITEQEALENIRAAVRE